MWEQVYLIGDPVQLPATVISRGAIKYKYDMSMFKRLQSAGFPVNMLDTQYRMHPAISAYPSKEFYHGNLKNGPDVAAVTRRPWHTSKVPPPQQPRQTAEQSCRLHLQYSDGRCAQCLGPFAFYDVRGEESVPEGSSSLENSVEAEIIVRLYTAMANAYPQLLNITSVAVISPYLAQVLRRYAEGGLARAPPAHRCAVAQVQLLRKQFTMFLGAEKSKFLDINTIDGFQVCAWPLASRAGPGEAAATTRSGAGEGEGGRVLFGGEVDKDGTRRLRGRRTPHQRRPHASSELAPGHRQRERAPAERAVAQPAASRQAQRVSVSGRCRLRSPITEDVGSENPHAFETVSGR